MQMRLDRERMFLDFLKGLENGSMLKRVGGIIFLMTIAIAVITGIELSPPERTFIELNRGREQYHVRRVSEIPRELEKDEAEKHVAEDKLSAHDVRQRYVSYLVSRIERNKLYPDDSQKKGHEGIVAARLLVARSGSVKKVTILRPARYPALTDAAIASIARSLPFEPFPPALAEEEMSIRLEIRFTLR